MWRAAKDHSAGDPLIILPLRRREIGHRKRRVQRKGSGKFTARLSPRLRVGQGKKRFFLVALSLRLVMSCLYSVIQRAFAVEDGISSAGLLIQPNVYTLMSRLSKWATAFHSCTFNTLVARCHANGTLFLTSFVCKQEHKSRPLRIAPNETDS